ncbi:aminoglycoside phosphotransferase family protein [Candidatus Venteria ishoeyi]|uniref:Phosphotransferase enzyme family protein n=1 Tax=Candidatus Venteria ishoeyi TaxID=1899563 RepID=A0A1H6FH15_9GAMM|nr:phosphotransferase [Candidatus Venteria ishoeyi]SEH09192.1 Phosphotransferase enzyme family protein [Candidatus Venteria ishoeyi]SEH09317.1 Phosphotransferase enzyme family protein [Candidatus Venteria ishoeyi]
MKERQQQLDTWLNQQAQSQGASLQAITNDASFRRYFRLSNGKQSWIVMDAPPAHEPKTGLFVELAEQLQNAGLNAPKILAQDVEQGFLLLTDLGSQLYLPLLQQDKNGQRQDLYRDALSALIAMQVCMPTADLPAYDTALLQQEMDLFPDWLLAKHLKRPAEASTQALLKNTCDLLCASALEQPQVFVHRDYHSRNLLQHSQHSPGILDFQDAVRGAITYDLVSLLRDAYIQLPRADIERKVLGYRELAQQSGILAETVDEAQFLRWFDWMGLQRHLKVAGIFARLYHRDGKPAYLDNIPLVLEYIVEVGAHYDEMQDLADFVKMQVLAAFH